MTEKMPTPKPPRDEQIELFEEDELVDPDKDIRKVLELIEEADAKRKERKRKKKSRKTAI